MEKNIIESWRVRVLSILMRVLLFFGGTAIISGAILAAKTGAWQVVGMDAFSLAIVIGLFFLPKRFFRIKAIFFVGITFLFGVFFTVLFGVFASGPLLMLTAPMLTAVFYGFRPAMVTLALVCGVNIAIGFSISTGYLEWDVLPIDSSRWAILSIATLALSMMVSVAISLLLEAVERSHKQGEEKEVARAELAEQLQHAQKMEAVGTLAGGIAHDFNNLLTVIAGFTSFAKTEVINQPEIVEDLAEVLKAVEKGQGLTSQLLSFSRKKPQSPETVDLNHIINDALPMMYQLLGEERSIDLSLSDTPCVTRIDPNSMVQVLINLVDNAKRASSGSDPIMVSTQALSVVPLHIAGQEKSVDEHYVSLSVSDTGCGMKEETLSQAFDPFFTSRPESGGTGLGLSTCWAIVDGADGYIWLESTLGKGTTVQCLLPRAPEDNISGWVTDNSSKSSKVRDDAGSCNLLLVEDELPILKMVGRLLRNTGYHVWEASSGDEALSIIVKEDLELDLLITDVMMPGMNGKQLADRVVEHNNDTRVIFISGYSDDVLTQHGVLEPGVNLLMKPFSNDELLGEIEKLVG